MGTLDEEELLHAIEARNEAIQMEMEVEEAAEEDPASRHIVEPAPLTPEQRRIGAGLGFQFLGLGAGASAGIGNGGIGFNGNAGFGNNFLNYGTPAHYQQYYLRPQPQYQYGQWTPEPVLGLVRDRLDSPEGLDSVETMPTMAPGPTTRSTIPTQTGCHGSPAHTTETRGRPGDENL